jgi:integrase
MSAQQLPRTPDTLPCWQMPLCREDFDCNPVLTPEESRALAIYTSSHQKGIGTKSQAVQEARQTLARLEEPLAAVHTRTGTCPALLVAARRILWREMLRRGTSFWAWDAGVWREVCGGSVQDFDERHGHGGPGTRHHLIAVAYLLGGVHDVRPFGLGQAGVPLARTVFGAEQVADAVERVTQVLYGPGGLGFRQAQAQHYSVRWALCLALLLNRSPHLEALSADFLLQLAREEPGNVGRALRRIALALEALGLLDQPVPRPTVPARPLDESGVPEPWVAWCRAWYDRAVHLAPKTRRQFLHALLAAGRWLRATHPTITTPEQWDEDLALEYVQYLSSTARMGDDVSPLGQRYIATRHQLGLPFGPRSVDRRLGALRRVFTDWQYRPYAVAGAPPRTIPIRFQPQQAFSTPRPIRQLIRPDPRDIDLSAWYKLAYAAATLSEDDLVQHSRRYYPLALYRAMALLWVTTARRSNELRRLRVGCVRREWEPAMLDEEGQPLGRAPEELCYLHVPPNKTAGAFWIWMPRYTADAVEAWERERPTLQPTQLDPKDRSQVDYLFLTRTQPLGERFLNRQLIPLLCAVAGIPERDVRGQITAHRGRSTRATLLRKLGVPLADIAAYLGHTTEQMVRHYARTDDTQLALTIKRADERSRLVEGLIDVPAAQEGKPNVFFFLGSGPDGKPRYCGNPAWASCPHRLACLKCRMYIGGEAAELLEVREGVLRFQTQVPMTPLEQAAADGDTVRLRERLAELQGIPVPEPPSEAFIFNSDTVPASLPVPPRFASEGDRRTYWMERRERVQRDVAVAREAGKRTMLVKALEQQLSTIEAELAALDRPDAAPTTDEAPSEQDDGEVATGHEAARAP